MQATVVKVPQFKTFLLLLCVQFRAVVEERTSVGAAAARQACKRVKYTLSFRQQEATDNQLGALGASGGAAVRAPVGATLNALPVSAAVTSTCLPAHVRSASGEELACAGAALGRACKT